jgi:hypothetical protein
MTEPIEGIIPGAKQAETPPPVTPFTEVEKSIGVQQQAAAVAGSTAAGDVKVSTIDQLAKDPKLRKIYKGLLQWLASNICSELKHSQERIHEIMQEEEAKRRGR